MTPLLLASLTAGACFFAWPLRMNQSGLSAASAIFMYAIVSVVVATIGMAVVPGTWPELRGRPLGIGVQAGVINALGMVAFTYMLAHATTSEAPRYILIVITMQTALTGAWAAYQRGALEPRLALGLATALATVVLLRGA